jgi:hypothetical protein
MINGTVLKGKVVRVTSEIINVETDQGFRKFSRVQVLNNRDIVEVGFFKKRIISGKIFFATKYTLEMFTPEGILKMNRFKVKNIVLGHVHQPEEHLEMQLPEQVEKGPKDLLPEVSD